MSALTQQRLNQNSRISAFADPSSNSYLRLFDCPPRLKWARFRAEPRYMGEGGQLVPYK
jgi:hypothetical protein